MVLGKKRKLGRQIEEINVGEKLEVTEKIEDKDLLLYLGLSDDNNPLFIQHDYASMTPFKKPIVPHLMLTGIINAAISKYLPGPGSAIMKQELAFLKPVYHYGTVLFQFEIVGKQMEEHLIDIKIEAFDEDEEKVIEGLLKVCPPYPPKSITSSTFENF
jgi:3-hydroxybutyryl-CoA dehydratase